MKTLILILLALSCIHAWECGKVYPDLESVVTEVTEAFSVRINLDSAAGKSSTAMVIGPNFQGEVPLDDILRKFHLACCKNVDRPTLAKCPTLSWRNPSQWLTLGSILESQANHLFVQSEVMSNLSEAEGREGSFLTFDWN